VGERHPDPEVVERFRRMIRHRTNAAKGA
jgi:hypothetical protein